VGRSPRTNEPSARARAPTTPTTPREIARELRESGT
jgi:hypothetical protein